MNATLTDTIRNGIDLAALQGATDAVRANPTAGQTRWAVHSRWLNGTRSDHVIDGILPAVRRPDPVGDLLKLDIAWRQDHPTARESVATTLEDIDQWTGRFCV